MPVHDLITEVDAFKKKSNQSQDEWQTQALITHLLTIRQRFTEMPDFLVFAFVSIIGGLLRKSNSLGTIVCNH